MSNALRNIILCLFSGFLSFVLPLSAQQTAEPTPAPVPPQVTRAKKVFVVNAEGNNDPRIAKYVGGPNGVYNQFYADVKNSGRFEIVASPADADVGLQVTLANFEILAGYPRFKLSILDPKTNMLLWTVSEPLEGAILAKTARRNVAQSLARLTQDLVALVPSQ